MARNAWSVRFLVPQDAVLRMDHLETGGAAAHFAKTGHMRPTLKLCLLLAGKMKKAEGELAATVAYSHEQVASPAIGGLRKQDLATDKTARAGDQRPNPDELRAVLVPQRQQKQQVLDAMQPELLEFLCERRADALKRC
jgi:hypothetical protein